MTLCGETKSSSVFENHNRNSGVNVPTIMVSSQHRGRAGQRYGTLGAKGQGKAALKKLFSWRPKQKRSHPHPQPGHSSPRAECLHISVGCDSRPGLTLGGESPPDYGGV